MYLQAYVLLILGFVCLLAALLIHPNASEYPMTSVTNEPVSYVNRVGHPTRQIHFHLGWLGDIVEALAKELDRAAETLPRKDPDAWWVHGDRPRPKRTPHARRRA